MEKIQKRKTEHVSYGLIRAQRKTMALKVSEDGDSDGPDPLWGPTGGSRPLCGGSCGLDPEADRRMQGKSRGAACVYGPGTGSREAAGKELLLKKCRYFAERMGVSYGTVTVREQNARWGLQRQGKLEF